MTPVVPLARRHDTALRLVKPDQDLSMKIGILQTGQAPQVLKDKMGDYPELFIRLLAGRGLDLTSYHVEGSEVSAGW